MRVRQEGKKTSIDPLAAARSFSEREKHVGGGPGEEEEGEEQSVRVAGRRRCAPAVLPKRL